MSTAIKIHPFLAAGMGEGPYSFAGFFDLDAALNPNSAANFGNMTGGLKDAPKLKAGLGTCACCGHGIRWICIVRNNAGELYGVGSDCIEKLATDDDHAIRETVATAKAQRQKAQAAARREAQRQARHAAQADERQRRAEEQRAAELADCRRRYELAKQKEPLIALLWPHFDMITGIKPQDERGAPPFIAQDGRWASTLSAGFFSSILASLLNGHLAAGLPTKAKHILADDFARASGRRGSAAYENAYARIQRLIQETATA